MNNADSALRELVERAQDLRHLIVMDTQYGWGGETSLKLTEIERLVARGWVAEGDENCEYDVTDAGRVVIRSALAAVAQQPAPAGMVMVPDKRLPDDGNGDDDAYNAGWNACRADMLAAAQPPGLNEAFDQVGAAMMREVCGDAAPAAQVAEEIDPDSCNFKAGLAVGQSCEQALADKILRPICDRCGARSEKESFEKCSSYADDCPGTEFPLSNLWELSKGTVPAAYPSEDHGCVYENGDGICRECADLAAANKAAAQAAQVVEVHGTSLRFGIGAWIVNTGEHDGQPCVFIDDAPERGEVGESAPLIATGTTPRLRLIFPTTEQAKSVADALVAAAPAVVVHEAMVPALAKAMAAVADAAPGPWETDTTKCDGDYGAGDEPRTGFMAQQMLDLNGLAIFDSLNADARAGMVEVDQNDDSDYAWDVLAERNFKAAAAAVNFVREHGDTLAAALKGEK